MRLGPPSMTETRIDLKRVFIGHFLSRNHPFRNFHPTVRTGSLAAPTVGIAGPRQSRLGTPHNENSQPGIRSPRPRIHLEVF